MSLYFVAFDNVTMATVNDATNYADSSYTALVGGTTYQIIEHVELNIMGLAAAAGINRMVFARDSTLGATSLSGGKAPVSQSPYTTAPGTLPTQFNASTTKPQRAATGYCVLVALQCFGGIFRWRVPMGEGVIQVGSNAFTGVGTGGEMSLSAINGTQAVSVGHTFDIK